MAAGVEDLTEDAVISAVCALLTASGWQIEQRLRPNERGVDVVAREGGGTRTLVIEAKGATSSQAGSRRHGKPFERRQVASHVARAFYTSASSRGAVRTSLSAMALPQTPVHEKFVERISEALAELSIGVLGGRLGFGAAGCALVAELRTTRDRQSAAQRSCWRRCAPTSPSSTTATQPGLVS